MHETRPDSILTVALCLLVLSMLGCDGAGEQSTASLSGIVTDSTNGMPVSDARVRVSGNLIITGTDGRFAFEGLAAGSASLGVNTVDFDYYTQDITLTVGENTRNVELLRRLYADTETGGVSFTLRVTPSVNIVRAVLLLLSGTGEASNDFVRGEGNINMVELPGFRDRLLETAGWYDLALMGADIGSANPAEVMGYVFDALDKFATSTRHPELAEASIIVVGYSLGGCMAYDISDLSVNRLIGFIRQKASCLNIDDRGALKSVPGYNVIGELDTEERRVGITAGFEVNRQAGAVWALITEPNAGHTELERAPGGITLISTWLEAILDLRLPPGGGPVSPLLPVVESSGWLGNNETFEIGPYACYPGDPLTASWLPTEETAVQWQAMSSSRAVTARFTCG